MSILVFDIETVADIKSARRYYGLDDLSDQEALSALYQIRMQENGSSFLPLHLQKIVCISVVYQQGAQLKVSSLAKANASEAEIISAFFNIIEKRTPTLVSWNGSGFDLPVLHYRTLLHGICAPRYFEIGEHHNEFRYNNYLSRYHYRHMDLMDILAAYQPRAYVSLDHMACLLGFPGKMGMKGSKVQEYFDTGKIDEIRAYCETDVLNTYLVYLRFEYIRGRSTLDQYHLAMNNLKTLLRESPAHLQEFLTIWEENEKK